MPDLFPQSRGLSENVGRSGSVWERSNEERRNKADVTARRCVGGLSSLPNVGWEFTHLLVALGECQAHCENTTFQFIAGPNVQIDDVRMWVFLKNFVLGSLQRGLFGKAHGWWQLIEHLSYLVYSFGVPHKLDAAHQCWRF